MKNITFARSLLLASALALTTFAATGGMFAAAYDAAPPAGSGGPPASPPAGGPPGGGRPGGAGGAGGGGGAGGQRPGGEQGSFRGSMMQTGRALRGLQRSAFDAASRDADLQAISAVQAGLVGAKLRLPTAPIAPQAQAKHGNDEAVIRMEMRKTLLGAIVDAIDLEKAIIDGDSAKAKTLLAKLNEMQDLGHAEFHPPEQPENAPGR